MFFLQLKFGFQEYTVCLFIGSRSMLLVLCYTRKFGYWQDKLYVILCNHKMERVELFFQNGKSWIVFSI